VAQVEVVLEVIKVIHVLLDPEQVILLQQVHLKETQVVKVQMEINPKMLAVVEVAQVLQLQLHHVVQEVQQVVDQVNQVDQVVLVLQIQFQVVQ
jgi:septum formation inhibitor-activating ATPase MinD